ncbi:hypothetical protein SUNI508_00121 [Seiridium unicorne]|uniref:Uncharacterized protein n=1 Tax=Seiridium unicorne TaxID=138068 RepID=A0ABR2VIC3_9PEZI
MASASRHRIRISNDSRNGSRFSRSSPAQIDFSNAAEQSDCVLFTIFPPEIRNLIFEYALTPDPYQPYGNNRVYCRPYMQHHPKTTISLLLSCKLIFRETRLMPVAQATHHFWILGGPWRMMRSATNGMVQWDQWQDSLSPEQKQAVQHVHIFAQQVYLERIGIQPNLHPWNFATKNLRLTFRHSDWWSWESPAESSDRLGICPWLDGRTSHQAMLAEPLMLPPEELRQRMVNGTWGWQVGQIPGLQRLEIEFETDAVKKEQLEKVLDRAQHWIFPLVGRDAALIKTGDVVESYWEGAADLKDDNQFPLRRRRSMGSFNASRLEPQRTYYVAVMTWKAFSETSEKYLEKTNAAN